ncbi:transglutaminase-like cysteine peptidase [Parvibaculum sp.]|uniref:transglutaminase-like cysteine peptidase n=1 Tax=Parvibaculum sp. TaxID=2024848 RepID=UPI0025DD1DDC|nr:transglutaminase-like cysteine peptidase [Parvibaculum sp.]
MWLRKLALLTTGLLLAVAGCQAPDRVGSIGFTQDGGIRDYRVAAAMPVGQQSPPPYGYIGFCIRNPDECAGGTDEPADMVLTPARWAELAEVNDWVNRAIPQVDDMTLFQRAEWWAIADERGGDCEDLALLKRKMLIERGWSPDQLLMAVVREWNGDGHAVLLVRTDRGEFVLDNKTWDIALWNDTPYQWIKRQSRERPFIWVNLDRKTFREIAQNDFPPLGEPASFLAALERNLPADLRPGIAEGQTASREALKEEPTAALAFN